ncbi:LLM class flavin-dependent oxidoreductase [Nocardioides lijunqiniae]|uniref:LLM class flavin-dependent oxidoreductase n=1 Tax=Nocardioides lijunqiniae TaxID=2760832 RepID=UPI0030B837F3
MRGRDVALKYSVLLPFTTTRPEQLIPYASLVEWAPSSRLWTGQSICIEPHQSFAHLAGTGLRVPVGIGVTLMPLRHPFEAAVQAMSLARTTGQPVTVGYGPGAASFQAMLRGEPYASQLDAVRDYLTIVRALVRGQQSDHDGEYFSFHGRLDSGPGPRVEVGAGVLRPRMARLVGEVADAAITWLAPASYIHTTLRPALEEGARAAGQPAPRIVSMVPLALHKQGRVPAETALASNAAHLRLPHYVEMLARAGIKVRGERPLEDAEALVEGRAFLSGDIDELTSQLREYEVAGVDEVVLNLTGVHHKSGPQKAMAELRTILRAVGAIDQHS